MSAGIASRGMAERATRRASTAFSAILIGLGCGVNEVNEGSPAANGGDLERLVRCRTTSDDF